MYEMSDVKQNKNHWALPSSSATDIINFAARWRKLSHFWAKHLWESQEFDVIVRFYFWGGESFSLEGVGGKYERVKNQQSIILNEFFYIL